ncbi:flagellar biosynthetic protein FliO [Imbroritus primus]|uniref:Flagellar biosynthetic protein FliO n=1 Tax=Imbroritus primus TaxID=3058603 RepID=A0ACD3SU64_9BURK|nr:flagellar biosynthetic protein FliO [Burkholderiaceae bacterium PBA]
MTHIADWIRLFGGLFFVLGMIVFAAWALRRLQQRGGPAGSQRQVLRVVGHHALGMKEKLVVVEIEDTWLVLGMTPASITTLHTLPRPAAAATEPGAAGDAPSPAPLPASLPAAFATQLRRTLSRDRE